MAENLNNSKRVAVVGGGIAGLATAFYLKRSGAQVCLYEGSSQYGGLGTFFTHESECFEKFYHCMLPSDASLLSLLSDLGIKDQVYWNGSKFAVIYQGKRYPLNTALDLLRFKPLPFVSRLRVGLTGLYGSFCSSKGLDDITAQDWLTRLSGKVAFERFWQPLLESKFGNEYPSVPALWFWTRFNREKGAKKEEKGYIAGGYKLIIDTLVENLRSSGVELNLNTMVQQISPSSTSSGVKICLESNGAPKEEDFDQVVVTTPLHFLKQMLEGSDFSELLNKIDLDIKYQGVVNVLLMLDKPLSPYYWAAVVDSDVPFQGIVETSTLMSEKDRAGMHLIYLMNYVHRSDALFDVDSERLADDYQAKFFELCPEVKQENLLASYVFKAPFVEPVYTLGFEKRKPPEELLEDKIFLCTTAQVYPGVTSWNASVGLVKRLVERMVSS